MADAGHGSEAVVARRADKGNAIGRSDGFPVTGSASTVASSGRAVG